MHNRKLRRDLWLASIRFRQQRPFNSLWLAAFRGAACDQNERVTKIGPENHLPNIRTENKAAPYVFGTQKCVSNESAGGRQIAKRQLRQPQKKTAKRITAEQRGRLKTRRRFPSKLIMSSIGGQRRSAPVKIPPYSESVGTNQERFNSGDIVFDIHGTASDFHRSESWNRYLLIPSHLSALKNEDKRISASVQRPNGKRPSRIPPSLSFVASGRTN